MLSNPPLPRNSPMTFARTEYSAYDNAMPDDVAALVEGARVSGVTAIYYRCAPHYKMAQRRIGDDMFYYVVRGAGEISVAGRTQAVGAGDCAHFRRGVL